MTEKVLSEYDLDIDGEEVHVSIREERELYHDDGTPYEKTGANEAYMTGNINGVRYVKLVKVNPEMEDVFTKNILKNLWLALKARVVKESKLND